MNSIVKYSLIMTGIAVIITLIGFAAGMETNPSWKYVQWLVLPIDFAVLFFAVKDIRDNEMGGSISFGQALVACLKIGALAGVFSAIFMVLYMNLINPSFIDNIVTQAREEWEKAGMTDSQIESAETTTRNVTPYTVPIFSVLGSVFFCTLLGLIVAAIHKREPKPVV
jgi:Na+/H+-dicarboxylate symporter